MSASWNRARLAGGAIARPLLSPVAEVDEKFLLAKCDDPSDYLVGISKILGARGTVRIITLSGSQSTSANLAAMNEALDLFSTVAEEAGVRWWEVEP